MVCRTLTAAAIVLSVFLSLPPEPVLALEITSQKTAAHVAVPGINAYFVPADELVLASSFDGFESQKRNIEVVVAYVEAPIKNIEEGFTETEFKARGMELKSSGDFTIDGRRAVLYKVLHDDGKTKWGKWVMLASDGPGTLVVNAAFVSGDAEAASDLESMLKGVYMEPEPGEGAADSNDAPPVSAVSDDIASGDASLRLIKSGDSDVRTVSADARSSFDRREALSILARDIVSSPDASSKDERIIASSGDKAGPSDAVSMDVTDAASGDRPARRGGARVITEDGVISRGDSEGGIGDGVASGDSPGK
jgi:hypothetical protein